MERWRSVDGFDGYEVSDFGRVRSWKCLGRSKEVLTEPRPRKLVPDREGYLTVILRRDGKSFCVKVATMVAVAFVGPRPIGMEVRHIDGCNTNNRYSNLTWGSRRDQFEDQVRHGTDTRGERNGGAKLTNAQAAEVRLRLAIGCRGLDLAKKLGVSQATIARIKKGIRYASSR